jgi:ubiquinone/menaquinone biosynthesis C-methylase UbiE
MASPPTLTETPEKISRNGVRTCGIHLALLDRMSIGRPNRYADDWNGYSDHWDQHYAQSHAHLGDEWHDRDFEDRFFGLFVERFLTPDSTVLEIGPGGGKWTVRYAPLVKRVIVLDVAQRMLDRTQQRCEADGLSNVEYVLGDGSSFATIPDASIDFVFSFDVLVHLALEDTWPYVREYCRVMKTGGHAVLHYASNTAPGAWDKIERENERYRRGATLGQYYYHSPESLRRMFERVGLEVAEQYLPYCHCVNVVKKPSAIVPRLERTLARLMDRQADDASTRDALIADLQLLHAALGTEIGVMTEMLRGAPNAAAREQIAAAIRKSWRGL